ncbi:MAG: SAM-dependent methyltransferase [Alphaproteobacteria bacterium]|nr:SAM-dependent methyltransferase [Alphaproteobacteria bacterium]
MRGESDPDDLASRIVRRIQAHGPLSVAGFMAMALHDREAGYYTKRGPIGAAGDFVTAPEISQIFGELIGIWCADWWQRAGSPDPVVLAELGPGRGVLMVDALRAAGTVRPFRRSLRPFLVEASPVLRAEQQKNLADAGAVWVNRIEDLPDGPMLLIANEFLDALPIRQLIRVGRHWAERVVTVDPEGGLVFAAGPESPALRSLVAPALRESPPGTVVEFRPAAAALAAAVAERVCRAPGAALFIDYGFCTSRSGSTLSAVRRHRPVGILDRPGGADLSAHVDFAALAAAARGAGAAVFGPIPQGSLLRALGAEIRLAALCASAAPSQREALASGLHRLLDPQQMGTLFNAIAVASPGGPVPAGFAVAEGAQGGRGAQE